MHAAVRLRAALLPAVSSAAHRCPIGLQIAPLRIHTPALAATCVARGPLPLSLRLPARTYSLGHRHESLGAWRPSAAPSRTAAARSLVVRQPASGCARGLATQGGAAAEGAAQSGQQAQQQGAEEFVEEAPIDEPFAAKLSRWIWNTIKYSFGAAFMGIVFYAGYTIVVTLLPGGASANAIMRRAASVLQSDPEIVRAFGDLKVYGDAAAHQSEGRRNFVPEYTYTDELTDEKFHRVRFSIEGEGGRKAVAWAEVRTGSYDFNYLIVMARDKSHVWSIVDHRRPELTLEERQARVTTLVQDAGWTFFASNDADLRDQAAELGDYWLKVKFVRCDDDPARCESAGVDSPPGWSTSGPLSAGGFTRGVRTMKELEAMTKGVAKARDAKKGWSLFG